jgi:hypothetical protein
VQQFVPIRVICLNPPLSETTAFGLQDTARVVQPGTINPDGTLVFEATLTVSIKGDHFWFHGDKFVHGSKDMRFMYLTLQTRSVDGIPQIVKRIKVQLGSITAAQLASVTADDKAVLQVTVDGKGAASVPLLEGGWKVVGGGG